MEVCGHPRKTASYIKFTELGRFPIVFDMLKTNFTMRKFYAESESESNLSLILFNILTFFERERERERENSFWTFVDSML